MQKIIGLVSYKNSDGSLNIPSSYSKYFNKYGLIHPINPYDHRIHNVDLIVLMGGADVNPARYGEKPGWFTQNSSLSQEWFDVNILPEYVNRRTPIFGICRGFQTINVHFNGKLSQDITQEYSTKDRDELVHGVNYTKQSESIPLFKDSRFRGTTKTPAIKVNSMHHQGFNENQAGEGVIPVLKHQFKSNVEAFVINGFPIAAVQWHPEEIYDSFTYELINFLLNGQSF